jgi:hypothetical protein
MDTRSLKRQGRKMSLAGVEGISLLSELKDLYWQLPLYADIEGKTLLARSATQKYHAPSTRRTLTVVAVAVNVLRSVSAVCPNLFDACSLILSSTAFKPICDHVAWSSPSGSRTPQTNTTWILALQERRREGRRNDFNIVQIISTEWLTWIKRAARTRVPRTPSLARVALGGRAKGVTKTCSNSVLTIFRPKYF